MNALYRHQIQEPAKQGSITGTVPATANSSCNSFKITSRNLSTCMDDAIHHMRTTMYLSLGGPSTVQENQKAPIPPFRYKRK
jgi:hypothetical protein